MDKEIHNYIVWNPHTSVLNTIVSKLLSSSRASDPTTTPDNLDHKTAPNIQSKQRQSHNFRPAATKTANLLTTMSSQAHGLATQDITSPQDLVGLGITIGTKDASFEQALEEEAEWLGEMGIQEEDYAIAPLDGVAEIDCEIEEPQDDHPPKGRKKMRSEDDIDLANPLEEVAEESESRTSDGHIHRADDVEEPSAFSQTLKDFTQRPVTPNRTCKPFVSIFYEQMRDVVEEASGSDVTMPRTQSEGNVNNISNELFMWTHAPGSGPGKVLSGTESDVASANIESGDDDFSLPELQYNHHIEYAHLAHHAVLDANTPEEADIARARRIAGFNASNASLASNSSARVSPLEADVLREFLANCVSNSQSLHANRKGIPASKVKAKEVERIMESVLKEQKELSSSGVIAF